MKYSLNLEQEEICGTWHAGIVVGGKFSLLMGCYPEAVTDEFCRVIRESRKNDTYNQFADFIEHGSPVEQCKILLGSGQ